MSDVSGVLLAAAVVDASGLAKTVARSQRGLWTLVPPAGSQFSEPSVDALAWAVGGSGPARHFARTGQDLASGHLLCEVWAVQISPEGDPGPAGGGPMEAQLVFTDAQLLSELPTFTPPAAPKKARYGTPPSATSFPTFSSIFSTVPHFMAGTPPPRSQWRFVGYGTSYPISGGTPAGYLDMRFVVNPSPPISIMPPAAGTEHLYGRRHARRSLSGGAPHTEDGVLQTLGVYSVPFNGLRVRRNGVVGYDDLAGPISLTATEGPYPSHGQDFTLAAPISPTCPGIPLAPSAPVGATPLGIRPKALARAGGDFAVLYQDPAALTGALVTSTGNKGTLPVPSGGRAVYLVEITERQGRLYLLQLQ